MLGNALKRERSIKLSIGDQLHSQLISPRSRLLLDFIWPKDIFLNTTKELVALATRAIFSRGAAILNSAYFSTLLRYYILAQCFDRSNDWGAAP